MKTFDDYLRETQEIGRVESVLNTVIYLSGLPKAKLSEVVITETGKKGIVQSIDPELVEVILLESDLPVIGERVARTGENMKIQVSQNLLGRVVGPLMNTQDGLGPAMGEKESRPVFNKAPGIQERVKISEQLETGVAIVDYMIPLGKGQRELILGDQKTGRTTFLLQTIYNQAKKGTICIYVGIGKKKSDIKSIEDYLQKTGILGNCVIVFASSADPASLVYLAPYSAFTLAEYFRDLGKDVLIVLDDLTNHAKFYREISLLSKKMPARESYPGDIFHIHAKILERAGRIKYGSGSVSITALPVVETVQGDLTGYLPTNSMAMTDGHIFFDEAEFKKGRRPAVNTSLSVTRVGNQTQNMLEQKIRRALVEKLNLYRKAQELSHFGFDLPLKTRSDLNIGERLEAIFDQETYTVIPKDVALILVGLAFSDYWSSKNIEQVRVERTKLVEAFAKCAFESVVADLQKFEDVEALENYLGANREKIEQILYSRIQNTVV
ncbi:MAG: F0F1 ATP synthase subunit alpha [Candidatus Woykebacteria bacterium]